MSGGNGQLKKPSDQTIEDICNRAISTLVATNAQLVYSELQSEVHGHSLMILAVRADVADRIRHAILSDPEEPNEN